MTVLMEAEYKTVDDCRVKVADSLMWLNFESQIRKMIQEMVTPVIELSLKDRIENL